MSLRSVDPNSKGVLVLQYHVGAILKSHAALACHIPLGNAYINNYCDVQGVRLDL